jgi:hypothetical protein
LTAAATNLESAVFMVRGTMRYRWIETTERVRNRKETAGFS